MEKEPKNKLVGHYDQVYSEDKKAFGQGVPEAFVVKAAELLHTGASVIEFGAGQGRNALVLAERGFNVRAVEISPVGVDSMNRVAKEKGLSTFRAEVGDAREELEGQYDLIVSTFMLHHLKREEAEEFIRKIKEHTKEGGLNAIATFTIEGDFSKLENAAGRFYPALGEMRELYSDWEIISYTEENSRARATRPDGSPMFNIKAEILAKKLV